MHVYERVIGESCGYRAYNHIKLAVDAAATGYRPGEELWVVVPMFQGIIDPEPTLYKTEVEAIKEAADHMKVEWRPDDVGAVWEEIDKKNAECDDYEVRVYRVPLP